MATVIRTTKRKRGIFGTIMWWLFLAFNAIMLIFTGLIVYGGGSAVTNTQDAAEQAGAVIGTGIGVSIMISAWLTGSLILGLIVALTRGKEVTVERTVD
ncbi:hypothetical protein B0E33_01355 [Roseibium algicola]|uniref:Uncharacterized protein n=1 Tax=Roseibium algicola TaxID=2857014 RepID=A0ABN4WT88_9HYPH|nr:hypothetical protein [Roseibium aggregatum]AQQ02402.1 hypothetical protein B0E33_01355 [Roseibium aggregatum]